MYKTNFNKFGKVQLRTTQASDWHDIRDGIAIPMCACCGKDVDSTSYQQDKWTDSIICQDCFDKYYCVSCDRLVWGKERENSSGFKTCVRCLFKLKTCGGELDLAWLFNGFRISEDFRWYKMAKPTERFMDYWNVEFHRNHLEEVGFEVRDNMVYYFDNEREKATPEQYKEQEGDKYAKCS
jgi:hypothetical protein